MLACISYGGDDDDNGDRGSDQVPPLARLTEPIEDGFAIEWGLLELTRQHHNTGTPPHCLLVGTEMKRGWRRSILTGIFSCLASNRGGSVGYQWSSWVSTNNITVALS